MICFNFAHFEGFRWEIFRLIKELWAASVVWKSPGCWCVSSCFLSPFYPPFLCCFSLSITAFLLCCQSLAWLLSLSFRLSPDSQATSGWPSELTVSTGNIMGALCHHNILWHYNFLLWYPFVLRSARCHSQGVENVSVSPCPHQYHYFWNTHIATMEMTPPWGGCCPGWWQLYGSSMNKMLNYLANCF